MRWARLAGDRLSQRRWLLFATGAIFVALAIFRGALDYPLVMAYGVFVVVCALVPRTPTARARPDPVRPRDDSDIVASHRQALLNALPDPAMLVRAASTVAAVNARARELFPPARDDAPLALAIRDPDFLEAIQSVVSTGETVSIDLMLHGPVERQLEAVVASLHDPQTADEAPLILATFRDLTEAEQFSKMRADFVAHASHELRTPLTSLMGFIETMQGPAKDDTEAKTKFLGVMRVEAERMTRLVDDLLSLSRVEMKAHVAPRGHVDLNALIGHVIATVKAVADERSITIRFLEHATPAVVLGDSDDLQQVVTNLIQNAIKYGHEGGRVEVSIEPGRLAGTDSAWTVVVVDDGPGIAAEHLPRLTERFYRADVAESRSRGGTGLGLAIVKHIVARHRGELRVTSEVGKGSRFAIALPAAS